MEWRTLRVEFWLWDLLFRQPLALASRLSQENVGSTSGLADNEGRVLALTSYTEYQHFWAYREHTVKSTAAQYTIIVSTGWREMVHSKDFLKRMKFSCPQESLTSALERHKNHILKTELFGLP